MLSEKVKQFIDEMGMSKTMFCKKVNISYTTLYNWLKGTTNLSEETQERIANFIGKYGF